jgi:hypothetical protein
LFVGEKYRVPIWRGGIEIKIILVSNVHWRGKIPMSVWHVENFECVDTTSILNDEIKPGTQRPGNRPSRRQRERRRDKAERHMWRTVQ